MGEILTELKACLRRSLKIDLYEYLVEEWDNGFHPSVEKIAYDFNKFHLESVKILEFSLLLFTLYELYRSTHVNLVVDVRGTLRVLPGKKREV